MKLSRPRRPLNDTDPPGPPERILATARRLFYAQGFPTTGINQIIAESDASKKSFYRYFPAKDDLGLAYLRAEKDDLMRMFTRLMSRYPAYPAFVRAWCFLLKKEAKSGHYHGCPFASFANQTGDEQFREMLQGTIRDWRGILERTLRAENPALLKGEISRIVDRILLLYEGAIQLWKITGEVRYFRRLEEELLAIQRW